MQHLQHRVYIKHEMYEHNSTTTDRSIDNIQPLEIQTGNRVVVHNKSVSGGFSAEKGLNVGLAVIMQGELLMPL